MPEGFSTRVYKKRYRRVLSQIAKKIPAAFSGCRERNRWIGQVTNARMKDMKTGADDGKDD